MKVGGGKKAANNNAEYEIEITLYFVVKYSWGPKKQDLSPNNE